MKLPRIQAPKVALPKFSIPKIDLGVARKKKPADVIEEQEVQLNEMQQAFADRRKNEQARMELATDSEFWVAVCFQTREQKEAFVSAIGLLAEGDKYLDGMLVSKAMGIDLQRVNLERKTRSLSPHLKEILP